jgi:hypothetical protein
MIYYAYGTALLSADELVESGALKRLNAVYSLTAPGAREGRHVDLLNGVLDLELGAEAAHFDPVGLGLPLTLVLKEMYTGKHPKNIFGGSKDMLFTSAVKSVASYEAKPRAVNLLTRKIDQHSRIRRPRATEDGTPYLFYSPAVIERSLTLDVEFVFDSFPQEAFDAVSGTFSAAGKLPLFLAVSPYVVAAGEIIRLAGSIGEKLFDRKPALSVSVPIDIQMPGEEPIPAGYRLITPEDVDHLDPTFRDKYSVDPTGALVDSTGKIYEGDIPYVIILVHGTEIEDLKDFSPHAASSAVLSRFLGMGEGQSAPTEVILEALKLYNDVKYRVEIDTLDDKIAPLPPGSEERQRLTAKREALLKNMVTPLLKPKA